MGRLECKRPGSVFGELSAARNMIRRVEFCFLQFS